MRNNLDDKYQIRKNNYQPNKLTLAKQAYTSIEKKIFSFIVNQINHSEQQSGNLTIVIPLVEIAKYVPYAKIQEAAQALVKKVIECNVDLKDEFRYVVPFPEVAYNINRSGLLEVTIYDKVVPLFKELGKEYTKYQLHVFLELESIYAQRMYEIISLHLGRREKVFTYTLKELQHSLDFPTKYENYDIKRFVLDPAQKELEEKVGIHFTYEPSKKIGKKVLELRFVVKTKKEIAFGMVEADFEKLSELNFYEKRRVLEKLVDEYPFNEGLRNAILEHKELLIKFIELDRGLEHGLYSSERNPAGYIAQSIRNEAILLGIEIQESKIG
jgi:plasmid replication initiation protein